MKISLDTNILLAIIPKRSKYRWAYDALREGRYELIISNEILEEYEEVLGSFYHPTFAATVIEELLNLPNVTLVDIYFRFLLIKDDPDDDKFVDAVISANADHIVTHDKHFKVLSQVTFPKVSAITLADFEILLNY